MNFIDTHTHLYDSAFGDAEGQSEAVRRALNAGVIKMVLPDESSATRRGMLELCKKWPGVLFPCIGLHPTELSGDWKKELVLLDEAVAEANTARPIAGEENHEGKLRFTAIGECGMDLYWTKDNAEIQEEVFRHQIELSLQASLPLIVHAREATEKIFKILDDYRGRGLRGVFHAFSGSLETFLKLDSYGEWYVGIGGVVTFKKAGIAEVIKDIPAERILLETDSPYLTPVPHRGERNESAYIPCIAAFVAERKKMDPEEFSNTVYNNSCRLFDFNEINR